VKMVSRMVVTFVSRRVTGSGEPAFQVESSIPASGDLRDQPIEEAGAAKLMTLTFVYRDAGTAGRGRPGEPWGAIGATQGTSTTTGYDYTAGTSRGSAVTRGRLHRQPRRPAVIRRRPTEVSADVRH